MQDSSFRTPLKVFLSYPVESSCTLVQIPEHICALKEARRVQHMFVPLAPVKTFLRQTAQANRCAPRATCNRSRKQPRDGKVTPNRGDASKHHRPAASNDLQSWDLKFAPCMAPVRASRLQRCSARLWRVNKSICLSPVVCVSLSLRCGDARAHWGRRAKKILTATGSSKSSVSLFLCCQLASLSLTNCSINSSSFPPSLQLQSSSCLLLVLCYAHRTDPPAGAQTWALFVSAPFFGRDESGVNSTCQPIFHTNRCICIMASPSESRVNPDDAPSWRHGHPLNDAGAQHVSGARKSIWWAGDHCGETARRVGGSLYVISMEIKQRSTERRILRRDQTQPTTEDQRESKHSLGKTKKMTCCKGRISSKIAQKRCLPGWVHGFRKAVRISIKREKNNEQSSLCDPLWRTPTDHGKTTGPHVSKLFWAPLQHAAGMYTEVIRRGLARAVMVNSKRVSRCPWESSWTVTEGLSRISVTLSPWERPLRTTQKCTENQCHLVKVSTFTWTGRRMKVALA